MTEPSSYLNIVLAGYGRSFDIYKDHTVGGKCYKAYAYFSSLGEKYVLVKKAKLWSVKAFEHVFFLEEACTPELLADLMNRVKEDLEPDLVRHGEKYPEKDHMYTYLTFVILTTVTPDEDTQRAVRAFRFDRGYLFSMRGHAEARLVVADLSQKKILTNGAGRSLKKMYAGAFARADSGAKGYNELFEPGQVSRNSSI